MRQPSLVDDALAALEVDLACLRQLDAPCGAVQEAQTQGFLQRENAPRKGRTGQAECGGRPPEASGSRDLHEQAHISQMFHVDCAKIGTVNPDIPALYHMRFLG